MAKKLKKGEEPTAADHAVLSPGQLATAAALGDDPGDR